MTYRIRQPHDGVGCIMASYGSQHEFSDDKLLAKGLFGNLLQGSCPFLQWCGGFGAHDAMSECFHATEFEIAHEDHW